MVALLALKVFLTPLLIAVASLVQRRFSGLVGGLVAGLPPTSAPVSVFVALQYGESFAAKAAAGSLLGSVAMSGFCAVYVVCAQRLSWLRSLLAGATGCGIAAICLSRIPQNISIAAAVSFPSLLLLIAVIGPAKGHSTALKPPWWDIPARMTVAATAVLLITGFARILGPTWSGLLATLPVFAAVMGVFSHLHAGPAAAHAVLRGIAVGALGAAVFFVVVGGLIELFGIAITYLGAVSTAVAVTGASHLVLHPTPTERLYSDAV